MADEEIKIQISADDQASAKLRAMGETARKTGETARLGMYALGEAAETAGEKMGIPREVSRHLGSSVERMAQSLGVAGVALGAVGLAATSAALIWKNYREEQEKIREEKIKQGQQAGQWLENISAEVKQSKDLAAAKRELMQAEFDLNKARAEAAIPALIQKLDELKKKQQELAEAAGGRSVPWFIVTKEGENVFEASSRALKDVNLELGIVAGQLGVAQAQAKAFSSAIRSALGNEPGTTPAWSEFEFSQMRDTMLADQARTQAEVMLQIERDKYNAIQDLRYIDNQNALKAYEEEQRINRMREQGAITLASNIAQMAQLMSQLNTSNARKWFSVYKMAAIGETIMTTVRASMAAFAPPPLGLGPVWGGALAASITALGAAKVAQIRAQTFEGGGGGAVGTFAANPATGLPESSGAGGPSSIIINVNGQQVGVLELTGNVLKTIYNNNGSVDGFSVSVERSA